MYLYSHYTPDRRTTPLVITPRPSIPPLRLHVCHSRLCGWKHTLTKNDFLFKSIYLPIYANKHNFLLVCIFRKVALLAVFSANKYYKIHSYIFRNKNMSLSFYLSFSPQRVPNIAQLNFPAMNTIRYKIQSKTQKADSKNKSQHTNNNNKNSIVQTND